MNSDTKNTPHPFLVQVQRLFQKDLALENDYLRQENQILRSKFKQRLPLTDADRRLLVKYGMRVKDRLADIATIVKPETILAWNRRMKRNKWTYDSTPKKAGRPNRSRATGDLVVRLAEDNGSWGYKRIAGELQKLGHKASPSYVRDILKSHGILPSPNRKGMSWKQFITAHMDVTWATDFFTEEVWSPGGLVTFYVLFYIHLGTRRGRRDALPRGQPLHVAGRRRHPPRQYDPQEQCQSIRPVTAHDQHDL